MIEVGNIVTLENGQEYLLLEEIIREDSTYMYAVRTLEDETPTNEYLIFEAIVAGENDEYLKPVDDKELYDDLLDEFREIIAEKIIDLNNELNGEEAE